MATAAEKFAERLVGGKFRMINEKLYTNKPLTRKEAAAYHDYYEAQVRKWPVDPRATLADGIAAERPEARIADIGAGRALLAQRFPHVTSFDKYPLSPSVVKAELDALPVADASFDIAVTSLSLMVEHVARVAAEINRVLVVDGEWHIAEVRSRIVNLSGFIRGVEKLGFRVRTVDTKNTHFIILIFTKISDFTKDGRFPDVRLRPCTYKSR